MKNSAEIKENSFPPLTSSETRFADYWELTKPRLTFLVLVTTFVGFCMGSGHNIDWTLLMHAMGGTTLVAAGAAVLNQLMERELDARMHRTAERPLPTGRLKSNEALLFGVVLSVTGLSYLLFLVSDQASFLAALTLVSYLFLYTPLKQVTPLCTLIGAIPGAIPPMIGWSAASGKLDSGAWMLFAILFFWQMPHFYALAYMYRDDYERGGFSILTVVDPKGIRTRIQIVSHAILLIPACMAPAFFGLTGSIYYWMSLVFSSLFLLTSLWASLKNTLPAYRTLFLASILYLPIVMIIMVIDKTP